MCSYWEKFPGVYFTGDSAPERREGGYFLDYRAGRQYKYSGYRLGTAELRARW